MDPRPEGLRFLWKECRPGAGTLGREFEEFLKKATSPRDVDDLMSLREFYENEWQRVNAELDSLASEVRKTKVILRPKGTQMIFFVTRPLSALFRVEARRRTSRPTPLEHAREEERTSNA